MKDEPVFEYHPEEALVNITLPDSTEREINIKSGWSFGTGDHETTRLCIKALEELFNTNQIKSVLDIGCGSGVLSIVSSVLGAEEVSGIDIDGSIIDEARGNAVNNRLSTPINFSTRPVSEINEQYQLVTANILLKTIVFLLAEISEKVSKDGFLITSGIKIKDKDEAVNTIERSGFSLLKIYSENDWVAILFKKS